MTFTIHIPAQRQAALNWVIAVVFRDFLNLPFHTVQHDADCVVIKHGDRQLKFASHFPNLDKDLAAQMPRLPLSQFDPRDFGLDISDDIPSLPLLFGEGRLTTNDGVQECGVDVFGTIFFMLSRFEEIVNPDRDQFDRFTAEASIAKQGGFLFRPIVDEYIAFFVALLRAIWPNLSDPNPTGRVAISCDVDQPFDRVETNPRALLRSLAGDIVLRRSITTAWRRSINFFTHKSGNDRFDPFNTFDWYLDVCERFGHRAAFYFISENWGENINGNYDIFDRRILHLMQKIHSRGHEIGMHGSFDTYRNAERAKHERERLIEATHKAGLVISVEGNRQHYLRWDSAVTPDILDEAGFAYDATGSFPDSPGFRYGTARSFPMWSWQRKAPLTLRQKPLVVMECSVFARSNLGLGYTIDAMALMQELRLASLRHGGDFSLLWHNSHFLTKQDKDFFVEIVR